MTKEEIEKLLKVVVKTNRTLAFATANLTEVNIIIVDTIMKMNLRRSDDDESPPTMQ